MKKITFISFFSISLFAFSQVVDESSALDDVLDELFKTDTLSIDLDRNNYLYSNFSFDDKVYFAGRDFEINQFGFTPSISYMRGQNFFLSLGSVYFSKLNTCPSYSIFSGISRNFRFL